MTIKLALIGNAKQWRANLFPWSKVIVTRIEWNWRVPPNPQWMLKTKNTRSVQFFDEKTRKKLNKRARKKNENQRKRNRNLVEGRERERASDRCRKTEERRGKEKQNDFLFDSFDRQHHWNKRVRNCEIGLTRFVSVVSSSF